MGFSLRGLPTFRLVAALAACALLAGCGAFGNEGPEEVAQGAVSVGDAEKQTGISADEEGDAYAAGKVLVTFADGTSVADAKAALQRADAVGDAAVTEETLVSGSVEGGVLRGGELGDPVVSVRVSPDSTVVQAVAELQRDGTVADVQPDYLYELQ